MLSRLISSPASFARRVALLLAVAALLLVVAVPAPAQPELGEENPYDQAIAAGEAALEAEDYTAALQAFNSAAQMAQQAGMSDYRGVEGRAQAYVGLGNYEAAETDFQTALDYSLQNYVPAFIHRGDMYLEQGMYGEAIADFEEALKKDPTNLDAQFGLGKAYISVGGAQQGVSALDRYIEANQDNAEAYRLHAQGQAGMGKYDEAMADLDRAISLEPDNHEGYFLMGRILSSQKQYGPAIAAVDQAIANYTPPEGSDLPFFDGFLTSSSMHLDFGKNTDDPELKRMAYEGAVQAADQILALTDKDDYSMYGARAAAEYSRALGYRYLGQFGKAIKSFSEALRMNPSIGGGEVYLRRGICFHYIGEDELAVEDFEQAANIQFDDPRPRLWQGFAYTSLGDYYNAIKAYNQATAADERFAPAYINRGLAYMMLADYEKAIDNFNEAIRLNPTEPDHYFKRGVALAQMGRHDKAAESFASAMEFDNEFVPAYRHMAMSMDAQGRGQLANEYRRQADALEAE